MAHADLSKHAEETLDFLKNSGLNPEQAGLVSAVVLCGLVEKIETAHKMVDFIDYKARADSGEE